MPKGHRKGFRWTTPEARFWKYVYKTEQCWNWIGVSSSFGYGQLRINDQNIQAHRFSWELHHGPIPNHLCVLHRCDNPPCVRPDHLFLGTKQENTRDAQQKARLVHGEATCTAKLTSAQVVEIRQRVRLPPYPSQRALAHEYGVHAGTISAVVRRVNWKHLP